MCWADKLAILIVTLAFLFLFAIADNKWGLLGPECWSAWGQIFLVVWLPLRLFDWVIGGPFRRSAARRHSPSAPSA